MEVQVEHGPPVNMAIDGLPRLQPMMPPGSNGKYSIDGVNGSIPIIRAVVGDKPVVFSLWRMGFWERLLFLWTGKLWMCSDGALHGPVALFTGQPRVRLQQIPMAQPTPEETGGTQSP